MADFNITPLGLDTFEKMFEDELWEDLGHVAGWWGGVPDEPTCQTRAGAKATRIDGVLANMWAVPYVKSVRVFKEEMVPTHSVFEVVLTSLNQQTENTYIKSLPSLKQFFIQEMLKQV